MMGIVGFFSRSIPRRILASFGTIYLVTYLATALVVFSSARTSILESNAHTLQQLAELKYDRLDSAIETLATDVSAWSQLEVMNDLVSGDLDKRVTSTLENLKSLYRLPGDLYAFDAKGKMIAATRWPAGRVGNTLPSEWGISGSGLALLGKHRSSIENGKEIIAIESPIYGNFDRSFRMGTLVLSIPWTSVEKLLFSADTATILVDLAEPRHVLAEYPAGISGRVDVEPGQSTVGTKIDEFVVGRSTPKAGILIGWQVQSVQETRVVTSSLRRVGSELVLLGAVLAAPILILGRWLSNRVTAPVMELTRVVGEIADTDKLDARVPVSSDDELGTLARSFNRMTENLERTTAEREQFVRDLEALNLTLEAKVLARTEELEAAIEAQKRLIGDISHEIKSPLARLGVALGIVRLKTNDIAPKQFDRMELEIGNVSALASELLTLARLDVAPETVTFSDFDICSLVTRIASDAQYEAAERKSDLILKIPDREVLVRGNDELLRRAIENVVRNAFFYTTAGTPVEISVSGAAAARHAAITIRDEGPGVPEAALGHLFEPFYRVDEARARRTGGSGVGLSICQRVIQLHGGSVVASNHVPHGLIVTITLPQRPGPA